MLHLSSPDLAILRRLRERFLAGPGGGGDYWRSADEIALYDRTFGERIGWKWDAVLGELEARGWKPRSRRVVDWGCGSGIASRRVLEKWPGQFTSVALHDRSRLALSYASAQLPALEVTSFSADSVRDALLVVSHVINELSAPELARLVELAGQAQEVIWIEPGTHAESRRLGAEVREPLRAAGFTAVAPCTHSRACGMFAPGNTHHWCHSFARPPSAVFQDAAWATFGRELGIDLRSLPYSFQVLERAPHPDSAASRAIGHPREYKGYLRLLNCQAEGVHELTLQKRDDPALWKDVREGDGVPIYHWQRDGARVTGLKSPTS